LLTFGFLIVAGLLFLPQSVAAGTRSKSAFNETKNINAASQPADPNDIIVYTLSYFNDSSVTETVTFEDDLTDVLYSANLIDAGGGSLYGNLLRFPAVSIPSNTRVNRVFKVRIKQLPATTLDTLMSNNFGNGVDIRLRFINSSSGQVKGAYVAPPTGPSDALPAIFAFATVLGYYILRKTRFAI
jgi:hypothetical protein